MAVSAPQPAGQHASNTCCPATRTFSKIIKLITGISLLGLAMIILPFLNNPFAKPTCRPAPTPTPLANKYPGTLVKTGSTHVYFKPNKITVSPLGPGESFTLQKQDHPQLFAKEGSPYPDYYAYAAEVIDDQIHQKQFIYIYYGSFERGGFREIYGVIVDPDSRKVVYRLPGELAQSPLGYTENINNGSVIKINLNPDQFYGTCTACGLRYSEYVAYDPVQEKFVSVNQQFAAEFQKLLQEYDQIAANECIYQGQQMTVSKVQEIAGDEARCEDITQSGHITPDHFLTLAEFNQIRENIKGIIQQEETSLLE